MWTLPWFARSKNDDDARALPRGGDLTALPGGPLALVLSRLSPSELANVRLICHAWRHAVDAAQTSLTLNFPTYALTSPVPVDQPPLQLANYPSLNRLIMMSLLGADTNMTGVVNAYLAQQEHASLHKLRALHLVNVNLPVLPQVVCQLSGLQALDLSRNMLAQWSGGELYHLPHLTSFKCCHAYLAGLPKGLNCLTELQVLDISDNNLPDVLTRLDPDSFPALRVLGLERVGMEALSDKLLGFTRLEELKVSGNLLQSFPTFLTSMTRLTTLEISHAYFRQTVGMYIPEAISALNNLQRLAFGNASSAQQVQHLSALQGLTSLDLQWTPSSRVEQVPPLVLALTFLTRLNLGGGALTRLPAAITELRGLMWLDVRSNRLKSLPVGLYKLTQLRGLWLQHNKLRELPDGLYALKHLTVMDLANNALSVLPVDWKGMDSLRLLDLSKNKLRTIPSSFGHLSSLEDLNLTHNLVTHLPTSVSLLTALRTLRLGQNCLESVTACGGLLSIAGLHSLNLEHNGLLELPPSMSKLVGLKKLELSVNLLSTLPPEMAALTGLRTLIVSRNKIREVPSELGALTGLLLLDLSWNRLRKLAPSIRRLARHTTFNVNGNPMRLRFPVDAPKPRARGRTGGLLGCLSLSTTGNLSRSSTPGGHMIRALPAANSNGGSDDTGNTIWQGRSSGQAGPSSGPLAAGFAGIGSIGVGLDAVEPVNVLGSRGRGGSVSRQSPSEGTQPWRAKVMRMSRPWSWVLWRKSESRHRVTSNSGQEQ